MKSWSDYIIIYNEHFFDKSDGAMTMKIDIVRHLFFQHLFPRKAERVNNFVKICITRGRCMDHKTRLEHRSRLYISILYILTSGW